LCIFGLGLTVWQVIFGLARLRREHDENEREFFRHQLRRRVQASGLIAALGLAVGCGELITSQLAGMFYWSAVLMTAFGIGVLALADIIATQYHFRIKRQQQQIEAARLKAEHLKLQGETATNPETGDGNEPAADGAP